ncbi:Protein MSP1 [Vanrija pseudolonga]|uniref:Protein MSP1 n=1 Tax=Vanrija pseudolonga TaxID=143232 RepID=A0AAF0Y258_9TREE|nr:Protein MSP1 [Vanrija pseudolonga]
MIIRHSQTMVALRTRALGRARHVLLDSRPLVTSPALRLPRSPIRGRTLATPSDPIDQPFTSSTTLASKSESGSAPPPPVGEGEGDAEPEPPLPPTPSFPAIVTTLTAPPPPSTPLAPEHHVLFNHLATSFIPSNQPCVSPSQGTLMQDGPMGKIMVIDETEAIPDDEDPVIALVSPFEGGDAYIARAVNEVAGHLSADVVRLDLALGVGLDGPFAPLKETGIAAPPLPQSINPLLFTPSTRPPESAPPPMEEEEDEDDSGMAANFGRRVPAMLAVGGPGPGGSPFFSSNVRREGTEVNEDWINFFTSLINMQLPDGEGTPAARRILLLESAAAMSETFEIWWPSLLEAVRRRRRGPVTPSSRGAKSKISQKPTTTQPTTIVLSVPPSLLLPHTAESNSESREEIESQKDRIRSVVEQLGATVDAVHVVDGGDKSEEKLWYSSEEHDHEGRKLREEKRLRAIFNQGPAALLPSFVTPNDGGQAQGGHPILDMLHQVVNRKTKGDGQSAPQLVWKTLAVVPSVRDAELERHERTLRRRAVNAALMMRAVGQLGATLEEPLTMLEAPGSAPWRGRKKRLQRRKEPDPEWAEAVIAWNDAMDLASTAVGKAATEADSIKQAIVLKWGDIQIARAIAADHERHMDDTVSQYLSVSDQQRKQRRKEEKKNAPKEQPPSSDPVVEALKKSKDLGKHERRLLGCIVDQNQLAKASFDDVHLPFKTIDGIRTVISLPLLFPEAFQSGILKDHTTSGALLFGPPGTGKTLLARAIAAESGSRMLAIQPSDVNDMWVGEGEKLVKAVFSLARKLSPCVVFIDEVDSLFGARSARDASGGAKAHNQVLTEFMQEMDGLSSAISNRDKRVVVVGATNRPFDLDDAILRRLPRRLLVDLPTKADRKAILRILLRDEMLADDIDLDKIAEQTESFSGSDLKHLCVAAALAAVKELIEVPWKAASAKATARATKPVATSTAPGGSDPRADVRVAVDEPAPELVKTEAAPAVAEVPTAELSPAGKLVEETYLKQLSERASDVPGAGASTPSASETAATGSAAPETKASSSPTNGERPTRPLSRPKISLDNRLLHARHFDTALGEIRPSSSEEGTMSELRKWSEQYGEGGKKRGKKSGFGKGFGFGQEKLGVGQNFGRVGEESN